MRYTILLHYPELMAQGELDEAAIQEGMAAFNRYAADLDAAGVATASWTEPSARPVPLGATEKATIMMLV